MVVIQGPSGALAAHVSGEGAACLVLIAGGPGLSSDYLAPLDRLGDDRLRMVRFDARGVGGSSWPEPARFRLGDHAADVETVRRFVGAARVHLLAHSWGGYVAWRYLADHPDRVASLVLVASAVPDEDENQRAQRSLLARIQALSRQGFIAAGMRTGTARLHATFAAYFHDIMTPLPDALRAAELREDVRRAVLSDVEPTRDLPRAAADFAGPSLVIMGRSDPLGIPLARACAKALRTSSPRVVILEQAGHYPWLEPAARDRFEEEVRAFVLGT